MKTTNQKIVRAIIKRCPCCSMIKINVGLHNDSEVVQCADCYFLSEGMIVPGYSCTLAEEENVNGS